MAGFVLIGIGADWTKAVTANCYLRTGNVKKKAG